MLAKDCGLRSQLQWKHCRWVRLTSCTLDCISATKGQQGQGPGVGSASRTMACCVGRAYKFHALLTVLSRSHGLRACWHAVTTTPSVCFCSCHRSVFDPRPGSVDYHIYVFAVMELAFTNLQRSRASYDEVGPSGGGGVRGSTA